MGILWGVLLLVSPLQRPTSVQMGGLMSPHHGRSRSVDRGGEIQEQSYNTHAPHSTMNWDDSMGSRRQARSVAIGEGGVTLVTIVDDTADRAYARGAYGPSIAQRRRPVAQSTQMEWRAL